MTYATELLNKKFKPNIIIKVLGEYYSIRQPDSGLTVEADKVGMVKGLTLNPTTIDLRQPNTTISNYSFTILDKNQVITAQLQNNSKLFLGEEVEIWIGRNTGSFAFSSYFKMPITRVKTLSFANSSYIFSSVEATDRMNLPVFNVEDTLAINISAAATTVTARGFIDDFASAGTLKIDNEIITYTAKNDGAKQFTGCTRGTSGSTAAAHTAGATIFRVDAITANPITILLQILISGGGGGAYDVLSDGLGISNTLIDVTAIENIRDTLFSGEQFTLFLYGISNALKFIEKELLQACNLRFSVSSNSKISVAVLDQSIFGDAPVEIDADTLLAQPTWNAAESKIVNKIFIAWDFNEGTGLYERRTEFEDADSVTNFGARPVLKLQFKGIKFALDGVTITNDRGDRLLQRLSTPSPEISVRTQIDKSLINVGDKILLKSIQLPTAQGDLNFQNELEVLSRAINHESGDVSFRLAFTSYTGIRGCYISPSNTIVTVNSQKSIVVASGRGACYTVGWKMRLWNNTTLAYETDAANEIASITGDTIIFVDNFATTLTTSTRIKFPDYVDATDDQKRYGFISDDGLNFDEDDTGTYRITF